MLTKCVLGMKLKMQPPRCLVGTSRKTKARGAHPERKANKKTSAVEQAQDDGWHRGHGMGASQRLGRWMKAAAEMGPQSSWFPCHWILTQICQGPCGGCMCTSLPTSNKVTHQRYHRVAEIQHQHQPPPCPYCITPYFKACGSRIGLGSPPRTHK